MIPSFTSEKEKTASGAAIAMSDAATRPGAAAEGVALHARDDRRRAAVDRLEHRAQRVRVGDVLVVRELGRGAHPLDVGAGGEARPVPGEDDRARAADVDERLRELGDDRRVERVAAVGPRERDAEDVAVALGAEVLRPRRGA